MTKTYYIKNYESLISTSMIVRRLISEYQDFKVVNYDEYGFLAILSPDILDYITMSFYVDILISPDQYVNQVKSYEVKSYEDRINIIDFIEDGKARTINLVDENKNSFKTWLQHGSYKTIIDDVALEHDLVLCCHPEVYQKEKWIKKHVLSECTGVITIQMFDYKLSISGVKKLEYKEAV